ncbi:MAG: hypothetical protein D3916_02355 [Candidatus Electrothrix sp. MAN1_4]|nr:hypothetical protein [Candidatus Electrothrix sp. MAN1_4]
MNTSERIQRLWSQAQELLLPYDGSLTEIFILDVPLHQLPHILNILQDHMRSSYLTTLDSHGLEEPLPFDRHTAHMIVERSSSPQFTLMEYSWRGWRQEHIPRSIRQQLKPLQGEVFQDENALWSKMEQHVGKERITPYKESLLKYIKRSTEHTIVGHFFQEECLQVYIEINWSSTTCDVEFVFSNDTSFLSKQGETEHLTMFTQYVMLTEQLQNAENTCTCFLTTECNGDPRELLNSNGIVFL